MYEEINKVRTEYEGKIQQLNRVESDKDKK